MVLRELSWSQFVWNYSSSSLNDCLIVFEQLLLSCSTVDMTQFLLIRWWCVECEGALKIGWPLSCGPSCILMSMVSRAHHGSCIAYNKAWHQSQFQIYVSGCVNKVYLDQCILVQPCHIIENFKLRIIFYFGFLVKNLNIFDLSL